MKDIAAQIKALEAEQAALTTLTADLPASLPEPALIVWHHSSLCEFGMIYRVKTLSEAVDRIKAWNDFILPLSLCKGSCTSFRTPMHKETGDKQTPIFPITVKVSHFNLTFEFYALVNGHLLSIDVEFEHQAGFQQYASVRFQSTYSRYNRERIDKSIIILSTPAFTAYYKIKWWGGGDYPNDYSLYWDANTDSIDDIFTEGFKS